jgi:acyl-CoA thioesterase FadM
MALEAERNAWPALGGAALPFVTAGLDVRYRRPAPLHEAVDLTAQVLEADESQMIVVAELTWDGKPRASATAVWKRWRPR